MMLISANPTKRPKKRKKAASPKGTTMKRRRKTARPVARKRHRNPSPRKAVRRRRVAVHRNPVAKRRRRVHRNPSFLGGSGGILKEILSVEGAIMIGAAFAAPMVADYVQEKLMPSATGWTRLAIKAGVVLGGAYLIQKFAKKQKAALAFAVTGSAVLVADAVDLFKAPAIVAGVSESQASMLAMDPMNALAMAGYSEGLADNGYQFGLADGAFNRPFRNNF